MAGNTQTLTGNYLKRMAKGGHFKQKLGEAALALTECFCKADTKNQRNLGSQLAKQMYEVLTEVYGWEHSSAKQATQTLIGALRETEDRTP